MGLETLALIGMAAGLAGTGASMGLSMSERGRANKAMEDERRRQLGLQQKFQDEASKTFLQSLQQSGAEQAGKDIGAGEEKAKSIQKEAVDMPTQGSFGVPLPTITDKTVQDYVSQQGAAKAALQGYPSWQLANFIRNLRSSQNLGLVGANARTAAGNYPYYLQAAQQAPESVGMGLTAAGAVKGLGNVLAMAPALGGPSVSSPTGAQSSALASGYGPVNDAYASNLFKMPNLYPSTPVTGYFNQLYPTF